MSDTLNQNIKRKNVGIDCTLQSCWLSDDSVYKCYLY